MPSSQIPVGAELMFSNESAVGAPRAWNVGMLNFKAEVNPNDTIGRIAEAVKDAYLKFNNDMMAGHGGPAKISTQGSVASAAFNGRPLDMNAAVSSVMKGGDTLTVSVFINTSVGCCVIA